jgi:hypothetical protein
MVNTCGTTKSFPSDFLKSLKHVGLIVLLILSISLAALPFQNQKADAAASYVNIALDDLRRTQDFPYGILCDGDSIYSTLFMNGVIVKIDRASKAVQAYYNDPHDSLPTSSIQSWYSIVKDPVSGNLFVNELDRARVWRFNPTDLTWATAILVPNLDNPDNPKVWYPDTYEIMPTRISVDENEVSDHGVHTYGFNSRSIDSMAFANGFVWVASSHSITFDEYAFEASGIMNYTFSGLIKIDPASMAVVARIPIAGGEGFSAIHKDGDFLWLADRVSNGLFKFNLLTETVDAIVPITGVTNPIEPRTIATDDSSIYVPSGEYGDGTFNSRIIQISKADPSNQTIIDVGEVNDNYGVFSVWHVPESKVLMWTDGSQHIGSISLDSMNKTSETTTDPKNNNFGCQASELEFVWSGTGSAIVGFTDIPALTPPPPPPVEEATHFKTSSFGKVKSSSGTILKVLVQLEGEIACTTDGKLAAKDGTLKGKIKIGSNQKAAYWATFEQTGDNTFSYSAGRGEFGKVWGTSTLQNPIDCTQEPGDSYKTFNNTMKLTRFGKSYSLQKWTDNTVISFT